MPNELETTPPSQPPPKPRFFAAPRLDALRDHPLIGPRIDPSRQVKKKTKGKKKKVRYAAYVRISSEEQIGNYSLDAQKRAIEAWVLAQGGLLVRTYADEGHSGRTADQRSRK